MYMYIHATCQDMTEKKPLASPVVPKSAETTKAAMVVPPEIRTRVNGKA